MRLARVVEFTLGAVGFLAIAGCGGAPEQAELDSVESDSHYYDGGWGGGWGGGDGSSSGPRRARSYINPDTGMATANRDVNSNSSCEYPDQYDTQKLSSPGTTDRNVHNDACLYKSSYGYNDKSDYADTTAAFDSSGVGYISACPDPDGAGPKTSRTADRNGDGKADICYQSGYQSKGTPGDFEYHARLNNNNQPGEQKVRFCYDRNNNGCSDEEVRDTIRIQWTY